MKPLKKAFFIVPPTGKYIREDRCQTPIKDLKTIALRPPIDLLYCAAHFERGGSECKLVDYPGENQDWIDLDRDIREFKPDIVVLSITTPSLDDDMQAATLIKKNDPNIITSAKGAHFNVHDKTTLEKHKDLDLVFRGEYELSAEEMAQGHPFELIKGITYRNQDGEIIKNEDRGYIEDLDKLTFPARHLANNDLYFRPDNGERQTTIITNRGCPFTCVYCLAPMVGGKKNRYRSIENVIEEIEECIHKYGTKSFLFRSDLFTQSKGWVKRFCQEIVNRKLDIDWACNSRVDTIREEVLPYMKEAGCWIIAFGVESGVEETLEKIDKKATAEQAKKAVDMTKAAGIYTSVYMLMGLPWETEDHIKQNIEFFIDLDADFTEIFYAYPFPGTPYHDLLVKEGILNNGDIPKEAYGQPSHDAIHLTREELANWRKTALRKIYMRPSYIWKTIKKSRNPMETLNYVKHGFITLKDLLVKS